MSDHALKTMATADKILSLVEDSLAGLEFTTRKWPADFRVIIWESVASVATKRAEAAKRS